MNGTVPDAYPYETIDPRNPSGRVKVYFPDDLLLRAYKRFSVEYENLRCAKEVLDNPLNIYCGLRQYNPGYWCYTGRPREWYIRENVVVPFPRDCVFVVLVNDRFVVYKCRAEPADEKDNAHVLGWQDRFGALKWSANLIS